MANDHNHGDSFPAKEDHKKEDAAPPAAEDHKKEKTAPQSHPIENIVLVGRTGNGKSATGNSIAKQNPFTSKRYAAGVTIQCQAFRAVTPEGPILNIIDTPGLFDLSVSADLTSNEIVRCLKLAEGGLHAVLLVLSVTNRVTKEEEMVLSTLQVLFGSKIIDYLVVVFSGGDVLEDEGVTLDEYLGDNTPEFLKRVLILCGQRKIVFDNRTKDEAKKTEQVHELLNFIDLIRKQNNNIPYTDEMYHKIKRETERHEKELMELQARGLSAEVSKALGNTLHKVYEQNLKAMTETMEKNIRLLMQIQQEMFEIRGKMQVQNIRENMELQGKIKGMEDENMRKELEKQVESDEACVIL